MVSEIKKLNSIIGALEEHSGRVGEFSGVLAAVNAAKNKVEATNTEIQNLVKEHSKLVSETSGRLDSYGDKLKILDYQVRKIEEEQKKILETILNLPFMTFEQHKLSQVEIEKNISTQLRKQEKEFYVSIANLNGVTSSLKTILLLGLAAVLGSVVYLINLQS